MLITDLALWPGIDIVSRQSLGEVLREQWIQHRGTMKPGSAVRLGQLSGARYLLKGSFFVVKSQLTVDVHVLDVEHGLVVRARRMSESVENIPTLARQLATHIGGFFGTKSEKTFQEEIRNEGKSNLDAQPLFDMTLPNTSQSPPHTEKRDRPQSHIHATDMLLRLDRVRRIREEAWRVADEVWQRGMTIKLGSPNFDGVVAKSVEAQEEDVVWIPVSSFFMSDRLRTLHHAVHFSLLNAGGRDSTRGTIFWKKDTAISNRLFTERFTAPRRLFVRAISSTGKVMGVASEGSWRVDHSLQSQENGTVQVLVWPTRTIDGVAGFSTRILALHQDIHHFDAVVVSVPGERRMVSVEMIKPVGEQKIPTLGPAHEQVQIQNQLKQWFLENWRPRVAESLPVRGYLPGNRRTIQVLISGRSGRVDEARMSQRPNEDLLVANTEYLIVQLIGQCFFRCQEKVPENPETTERFNLRVQLDLVKDLQFVDLGEKVN